MTNHSGFISIVSILVLTFSLYSCEEEVMGCTDPLSTTYNPEATIDNGTCRYIGCNDPLAENYNPKASMEDSSSCIYAWDKFLGTYLVTEECPSANRSWTLRIEVSRRPYSEVTLINLNDAGVTFTAPIEGNTISFDYFDPVGTIKGSGMVDGKTLTLSYRVTIPFLEHDETCSAVGVRL